MTHPCWMSSRRTEDPAARAVVLDTARVVERVPELLSIGPHMLGHRARPGHLTVVSGGGP